LTILKEAGTMLIVSILILSASILKDLYRRLEVIGLSTGTCALLIFWNRVNAIRQDILFKQFNRSRFYSKS
jgi:hypothetical protein